MYRKELEWLALAKKYVNEGNFNYYTNYVRDAALDLFYNGTNLRNEFIDIIPVEDLAAVRRTLDFLKNISGFGDNTWSGSSCSRKADVLITDIYNVEEIMKKEMSRRSNFTIFYSWQSDSISKYNRNFIESCLSNAINKVDKEIDYKIIIDKNTNGESGSPDIVNVILNKIDTAIGFVADITPITCLKEKQLSNPNVMLELGYALSSLSDERIILICNTSKCELKDLPFDLGLKRIVTYNYDENSDRDMAKEQKEKLEAVLYEAVKSIANL